LFIGLPDALAKMIVPVGAGVLTGIIATYGKEAVAAYGIGTRFDMFALLVISSLASVLIPFVGQNVGAGEIKRAQEAIKASEKFVLAYGIFVAVMFVFTGKIFAGIFSNNTEVIRLVQKYLWIVPLSYGANGILLISGSILMVLKKPVISALLMILRLFLVNIPFALLGSHYFGMTGLFLSIALSFILISVPAHNIMIQKLKGFEKTPMIATEIMPQEYEKKAEII
jgi:Na+-driven multidrug efflux pump